MTEDLKMSLAVLDEAAQAACRALRGLGLSADAAKDAITVHVSDVLAALTRELDGVPTPDDGDGEEAAP